MLEDRDYMRPAPPAPGLLFNLSASVWLIVINFAVYALQLVFPLATGGSGRTGIQLENYLALFPPDLLHGQIWQLLTFQFLHGGPAHLLINCLMVYMFGRPLEAELGRRNFVWLYLGAGVVGGLLQAACGLLLPGHFGRAPTVGASAGVFGLIATFAMLHWNQPLTLLVAFVLPVTLKAKWLLAVQTVLAVFGLLRPDQIAHAAHLGGLIAGVVYVRYVMRWRWRVAARTDTPARRPAIRIVSSEPAQTASTKRPAKTPANAPSNDDFMAREVDPILEKISARGIQSLTEQEKRILETARQRMTIR